MKTLSITSVPKLLKFFEEVSPLKRGENFIPTLSEVPPDFRGRTVENRCEGSSEEREEGGSTQDAVTRAGFGSRCLGTRPQTPPRGLGRAAHRTSRRAESPFPREFPHPAVHKLGSPARCAGGGHCGPAAFPSALNGIIRKAAFWEPGETEPRPVRGTGACGRGRAGPASPSPLPWPPRAALPVPAHLVVQPVDPHAHGLHQELPGPRRGRRRLVQLPAGGPKLLLREAPR